MMKLTEEYIREPMCSADFPHHVSAMNYSSDFSELVQAREVDTMPIRSSEPVTINIHIMDANDNSPEFEQPVYTASTAATGDPRPIVMAFDFLTRYFDARKCQEWSRDQLRRFRPLLLRNASDLVNSQRNSSFKYPLRDLLTLKSALAYISADFPELVDTLMYSAMMEHIDSKIDSFNTTNLKLDHLLDALIAKLEKPSGVAAENHCWWHIVERIERKVEPPLELIELDKGSRERQVYEMAALHNLKKHEEPLSSTVSDEFVVLEDLHRQANYSRRMHKERLIDYLKFRFQNPGDEAEIYDRSLSSYVSHRCRTENSFDLVNSLAQSILQ